jgi:hypothetical protein
MMGTVPIPPPRLRSRPQHGGQSNEALLRLMSSIENEMASRDASVSEAVPLSGKVCRRFQILRKHQEEAHAQRQAEAALAALVERYGDQICRIHRGVLREWFAPEGLIGYVINGEIETQETLFALPGGICLSYEEIPGERKAL